MNLRINYVEMPAADFDAQRRFYSGAFGWTFVEYGPDYIGFNDGGLDGGFYRSAASSTTAEGAALIILHAADLEGARQQVLDHGGTLCREIFAFPGGRRFHFLDPAGNELAVWSDREAAG